MRASIRSLFNNIPLSSGNKIPPRSTWDIMSSAASACVALVVGPENRERFIECCNEGIIEPPVLGQANFGLAMMLALYYDLNSPLFHRYKDNFNAIDFSSGVAPSLARFHDIQSLLQNELHEYKYKNSTTSPHIDSFIVDTHMHHSSNSSSEEQGNKDSIIGDLIASLKALDERVVKTLGFVDKNQVQNILKHSWDHDVAKKSNSPAAQLRRMVTSEYFQDLQMKTKSDFILNNKLIYEKGSTKVQNVALLSVRSQKIYPEGKRVSQIKSMSKRTGSLVEEDFFDKCPEEEDADFPVVAQVEVLYDIEQYFRPEETTVETIANDDEYVQGQPMIKRGVLVGVFEGWLYGGPDRTDSLRWSLCLSRPAWEFPGLRSATEF